MRKFCIGFITVILLASVFFALKNVVLPDKEESKEYLRIHIRADSNDEADRNVKYKVKDAVVSYLAKDIPDLTSKEEAENYLKRNLKNIEKVADDVLSENGLDYKCSAKLGEEEFPTRVYDGFCLKSGYYDALILELGSGEGNNWWCVVYPPLCFTSAPVKYEYKSKIIEIIKDFKAKREK